VTYFGVVHATLRDLVAVLHDGTSEEIARVIAKFVVARLPVDYAAVFLKGEPGRPTFAYDGALLTELPNVASLPMGNGEIRTSDVPVSTYLNIPLFCGERLRGSLLVVRSIEHGRFDERDHWMTGSVANLVSTALSRSDETDARFAPPVPTESMETEALEMISLMMPRWQTVDAVFRGALPRVNELTDCNLSHVYRRAPSRLMISSDWWQTDGGEYSAFRDATRRMSFVAGEGLPGRVMQQSQSRWIENVRDDRKFPRRDCASRDGIVSACGVPILVDDVVVAVLECFFREPRSDHETLLTSLRSLCDEVAASI
jgi:GAF domain-containing protein